MMQTNLDLEQIAGQLVVGGFAGPELPAELERELAAGRRGGVILFKRNLPSLEAARTLTGAVRRACPSELPPFIGVDQEGGRVGRLPSPFLELPPMRALGDLGDEALVTQVGRVLGEELALLGFNLDFAPVLDVDSNPENPVIGDRSFSRDPSAVARLGAALILGLESAGVMACGKHFPGHGDTSTDSHLELPRVTHREARLRSVELPPFRAAVALGVASLMTAHVVYDGFDPGRPATLSRRICTELLRGELGFSGVLFSDDLEMRALADRMTGAQAAVGAIRAGCDALLVCSSLELQAEVVRGLVLEAEKDSAFAGRLREALERGLLARRRRPPRSPAKSEARGLARARALEALIASRR